MRTYLMFFVLFSTVTSWCIWASTSTSPQSYVLFENGKTSANYNEIMRNLNTVTPGSVFQFSKHSFRVEKLLGSGGRNLIFKAVHLETNQIVALRIRTKIPFIGPIWKASLEFLLTCLNPFSQNRMHMIQSLREWNKAEKNLRQNGARVVPQYENITDDNEFVAMHLVTPIFGYEDYRQFDTDLNENSPDDLKFRENMLRHGLTLEQIDQDFCKFVASFSAFSMVGDLRSDQIAYTLERGWSLLDMSDEAVTSTGNPADNPFEMTLMDRLTNSDGSRNPMQKMIVKPGFPPRIEAFSRQCFANALKLRFKPRTN